MRDGIDAVPGPGADNRQRVDNPSTFEGESSHHAGPSAGSTSIRVSTNHPNLSRPILDAQHLGDELVLVALKERRTFQPEERRLIRTLEGAEELKRGGDGLPVGRDRPRSNGTRLGSRCRGGFGRRASTRGQDQREQGEQRAADDGSTSSQVTRGHARYCVRFTRDVQLQLHDYLVVPREAASQNDDASHASCGEESGPSASPC